MKDVFVHDSDIVQAVLLDFTDEVIPQLDYVVVEVDVSINEFEIWRLQNFEEVMAVFPGAHQNQLVFDIKELNTFAV